ncbi:cupin domain-containing protein [Roseomonas sp. AR75]|jgi:quercetin dioxygenase-like cupin family protein|uniref:cupin domain-containing protein n=1 Tax=Roseomonas sp. AR75 TaxID=2562311 RepID=UPI0010C0E161|nr:cupin domain-containing protein [Roseomonas sp. AR75]
MEIRDGVRVIGPEDAPSYWQPVPANGFVRCILSGKELGTGFSMGTQTVAPGCMVREHTHDRHEEVIHLTAGHGFARIDGEDIPIASGSTVFLPRNRKHGFVNAGTEPMTFVWFLAPGGLEDFFAAIGRPRDAGQPAPEPFPRPADVAEIERRTVFGWADQAPKR